MTGKFQYSVLKYRHSYIAGEVFNIGILFLFDNGEIEFLYPKKLSRITAFFHDSPISFLKNTLSSFRMKTKNIYPNHTSDRLFQKDLADLISDFYLKETAGSLLFGEIKQGVYNNNQSAILHHFYKVYLGHYEDENVHRKNEKYILDSVKHIIKDNFSPSIEHKLKINKILTDPNGNFEEKFEYGWQNGSLNLITPISFDLASESSYEDKALKWFARLNFLKQPAQDENIKFDILLTEPKEPYLKKNFDKAIDLIERSGAPINFVEELSFKKYLKHAVEVVLDHSSDQVN